jgi:hypothetical protein
MYGKTQMTQQIAADPELAQAWSWYNKGVEAQERGDHETAIRAYDEALKIHPKLVKAWHNRGVTLRLLGKKEDALKSYDKALEIDPQLAYAWHDRAEALRSLGRKEDATSSHNKAEAIDPTLAKEWRDNPPGEIHAFQTYCKDGLTKREDKKRRAHKLALMWWQITGKPTATCDRCNITIPKDEGYVCKPLILGIRHAGSSLNVSGIPDMICEECFDKSPNAEPFNKQDFNHYVRVVTTMFEKHVALSYGSLRKFADAKGCYRIYESDTHYHTVRNDNDESAILHSPLLVHNPRIAWDRSGQPPAQVQAQRDAFHKKMLDIMKGKA